MAKPRRPASENCCRSLSQSVFNEGSMQALEDEEDHVPIFSLSKSSIDVVKATGTPHKPDPTWTRMDLQRSSSTNTHMDQKSLTFLHLHPHVWSKCSTTDSNQQPALAGKHKDTLSPPPLSERWIANVQRWSSGSAHSRSSTPETVIWTGSPSRPSSFTQEAPVPDSPHSLMSKPVSSPTTPCQFISPLQTPTLPLPDLFSSSLPHQQEDLLTFPGKSSPLPSPSPSPTLQICGTSHPLPKSPDPFQSPSTENEDYLQNHYFAFPSPASSSVTLRDRDVFRSVSSDPGNFVNGAEERLPPPGERGLPKAASRTLVRHEMFTSMWQTPAEGHGSREGTSLCQYWLPSQHQPGQRCLTTFCPCKGWKPPLVSSLSDSSLNDCCRFHTDHTSQDVKKASSRDPKKGGLKEEGTMTSQPELVDAAVQTVSPVGPWWRNISYISASNVGSNSALGSPPGSRLNLKSSVGSISNLVSPSSSMFPVDSSEEEGHDYNPHRDVDSLSSHDVERRSCLEFQREEKVEQWRRGSMKQAQWDKYGMVLDLDRQSLDAEQMSTAIQTRLQLHSSTDRRSPSSSTQGSKKKKKKKAPKPPLISEVVKVMAPEDNPHVMVIMSTCMVEGGKERKSEEDGVRDLVEEEGQKEEKGEAAGRHRKTEEDTKYDREETQKEMHEEDNASHLKSPSSGSGHSRKKSVIKSLRRTGWCGGSKNTD